MEKFLGQQNENVLYCSAMSVTFVLCYYFTFLLYFVLLTLFLTNEKQ